MIIKDLIGANGSLLFSLPRFLAGSVNGDPGSTFYRLVAA